VGSNPASRANQINELVIAPLRGYRDMKQLIVALQKRIAVDRPTELKAA